MLRPELVQRNAVPLSSDAFSVMGMHGANEHNCEVWDATQRLYSQVLLINQSRGPNCFFFVFYDFDSD